MMRRSILFCVLIFVFLFLSPLSVKAAADCPVCPDGYVWSYTYDACYKPPDDYIDPTYVDCGNLLCVKGRGCLNPDCTQIDATGNCPSTHPIRCSGTDFCCPSVQLCPGTTPFLPEECEVRGTKGIQTALGCIPTEEPQEFVAWLLAKAIGIAGGIAFLLMIFAGFQIITSAGDPKRLQSGKEMLTNAIIGLIVIIFAIFLLKVIGYDILRLPGFELLNPPS